MRERKKLLVLNRFQRWFITNFLIYSAIFLIILGSGLILWFQVVMKEIMGLAGLLSITFVETVQRSIYLGLGVVALMLIFLLGLAAYQSLRFSHRIAGPLFAFARHLERCEEKGNLEPLKLRKDDLFVELAQKFNDLERKVRKK